MRWTEVSGLHLSDRQWALRINILAALILVYVFAGQYRQQGPQVLGALGLILSLYLALLWSRRELYARSLGRRTSRRCRRRCGGSLHRLLRSKP